MSCLEYATCAAPATEKDPCKQVTHMRSQAGERASARASERKAPK